MAKVLVVEDEPDIADLIARQLRQAGLEVVVSPDAAGALERARSDGPQAMLLDLSLPDLDGFEVCRRVRGDPATAHIPVIIVTGRDSEMDRVLGFELGADDYVTKPFSVRELALRVRRTLERRAPPAGATDLMVFGDLAIDVPGHRVTVSGRDAGLTATEFRLLAALARRRGRVQSRERLLGEVWPEGEHEGIDARTVDTHVRRLRDKLGTASSLVGTVRGVGYRFDAGR